MKITTLIENTTISPSLTAEHGLSLFVEAAGHTFLFDAGQSGAFADNAGRLHIDLRRAEFAVLSHGHYDHGGGMTRFLECNHTAKIYVNQNAFGGHYNVAGRYIGLPDELRSSSRLILTGDEHAIAPGLTLRDGSREYYYTQLDRKFPGLKERTIRTYGSAYELRSAHHYELNELFHRLCEQHGIWHDNDRIFRWMQQLEEPEQLSFYHQEAI